MAAITSETLVNTLENTGKWAELALQVPGALLRALRTQLKYI